MSEQSWPVKAQISPILRPELLVGAASPLWGYFAGAALMGSTWWWMTRWLQPTNLEAVEAALEPATEVLAAAIGGPVAVALVADKDPPLPVGGESAPVSAAVLEAALIAEPALAADLAQTPEPVLAPEPAVIPKPVVTAQVAPAPEPVPAPKPAVIPEPVVAAQVAPAAEPAPAPKPAAAPKPVLAPEPAAIPEPVVAAEPEKKPEATRAPAPSPTPKRKARDSEAKPH